MASLALLLILVSMFAVHETVANPLATTIEVTASDGGTGGPECRLRDAITAANTSAFVGGCDGSTGGPFVIELKPSTEYQLTVVDNESNGLPIISADITVNGHNAHINRSSDESTPSFRLFQVAGTGTLTLNDVWVTNGGNLSEGGGLRNSGLVFLNNVRFLYNTAEQGAGLFNQEAGKLDITQSHLMYNYGGCGGAVSNNNVLTMTNTTLIGNVADI